MSPLESWLLIGGVFLVGLACWAVIDRCIGWVFDKVAREVK